MGPDELKTYDVFWSNEYIGTAVFEEPTLSQLLRREAKRMAQADTDNIRRASWLPVIWWLVYCGVRRFM